MTESFTRLSKSFTTATAVTAALAALGSVAWAGPAPVQLAQMNAAPKIQPAPPPNLARTPVITPKIDLSRLAGEEDEDETEKETNASPEQIPQETGGASAPELARQSPEPPAARLIRAPLPQVRPELFGGIDPDDLLDARSAAEAREAAEAAATAGVGVERSDLSGLGDPGAGDDGGPEAPGLGGMTPEEIEARFGLGGMKSPEEIAHGLATEFNDLGNRGTDSPTGNFADGFRPDPTKLPTGDLASNEPDTVEVEEVVITGSVSDGANEDTTTEVVQSGDPDHITQTIREKFPDGTEIVTTTTWRADGSHTESMRILHPEYGGVYYSSTTYDADDNVLYDSGGLNRLQTPEDAPGGGAGCAPSDGSAACQELRRLQREGNSPGRMLAGSTRVNPGDPDDSTGSGPRLRIGPDDLLGNPDPNSWGRGGGGPSARSFDGGALVNDEGGGTGAGVGE